MGSTGAGAAKDALHSGHDAFVLDHVRQQGRHMLWPQRAFADPDHSGSGARQALQILGSDDDILAKGFLTFLDMRIFVSSEFNFFYWF